MSKEKFNLNDNDIQEAADKVKFSDLDLGLDFDLSFLDDINETEVNTAELDLDSILNDKPAKPKAEPVVKKEAPVKKPAARKPAAPAPKDGAPKKDSSAKPPVKKAPAKKPAIVESEAEPEVLTKKTAAKKPAAKPAVPAETEEFPAKKAPKKAAPQEEPAKSKKKQKKGPRIGGVIFYTLYFMFILVFFIGTYIGLQWLHGWLSDYQAAQPTVKAEQVFQEVFTDPDWGALYDSAGAQDSPYEGKEEYVTYMENKVGEADLSYMETSAGLDKSKKKFLVRLGDENVASFTLVDKNKVGAVSLENLENITDIPDWQLGAVEVFFEREEVYYIEKLDGHTAYVNGVALTDDFTIQIATTKATEYLPEGTVGASMCTQEITGLMEVPTVTVTDKAGNQMEVTYDEVTRTFTERTEENTMSEDQKTVALDAAKTYCLFMIEEINDRGAIAKYFDPASDVYARMINMWYERWMQGNAGYTFENENVSKFAAYGEDLFSVRVEMTLKVTRLDGSPKDYDYANTLFFQKSESGKWLCFKMINEDVSTPVGKVRLTFMQGDTKIHSDYYYTDAEELVLPNLSVPAGQVFTGWVTVSEGEDGSTIYNLEFQPDETGIVKIPKGTTLRPMTLYAFFQNEGEVQEITEVPAETAAAKTVAAETAAETVPAETAPAETTQGA